MESCNFFTLMPFGVRRFPKFMPSTSKIFYPPYQHVHFQVQRSVPSPTFAIELYSYEARQA